MSKNRQSLRAFLAAAGGAFKALEGSERVGRSARALPERSNAFFRFGFPRREACLLFLLLAAGCSEARSGPHFEPAFPVPVDAEQALLVRRNDQIPTHVEVSAWTRDGQRWSQALATLPGVIGRKGFADVGKKREGDGKTPSGVFRLRRAFGYDAALKTGLEYRQATDDDFWVDDPKSPQYNLWVHGTPQAASFELMKRHDEAYQSGAVVEYNTDPVVPGLGSAIFLHIWGGRDSTTAGCVALSKSDVLTLLGWLDRAKNPVIILGSP